MLITPAHIRRLFLEPQATYSIADAASLLGMHWRDVRAWRESGEREGVDTDEGRGLRLGRGGLEGGGANGEGARARDGLREGAREGRGAAAGAGRGDEEDRRREQDRAASQLVELALQLLLLGEKR